MSKKLLLATTTVAVISASPVLAASDAEIIAIHNEIKQIKQSYEKRIADLEKNSFRDGKQEKYRATKRPFYF